ncbi:MAG: B12-binding domain-containing radical SAM protein [Dehalococcoidia bacterium]
MSKEIILILSSSSGAMRVPVREKYRFPPIGLLCLSSLLKIHGYKVEICDLVFEDLTRTGFVTHLQSLAKAPVIVGICVYTDCVNETLEIASLSKQAFPKTKIVLGGPHATFCYDELLQHESVDFVVRGEGESSIIPLIEHLSYPNTFPLEAIRGIACKTKVNGSYRVDITGSSPFITRLDILPFPDYPAWKYSNYYSAMFSFVSSRGCPGKCIFCSSKAFSGNKYRFHSAEWIFSMLCYYEKLYHFTHFVFMDDTFLAHKLRAKTFCEYVRKYWPGSAPPAWACKSRVDMIDEAIVRVISDTNCASIHLGLESGAQEVLDSIGKGITLPEIFEALKLLRKYGIDAECSFMIGHPGDTLKTIEKTLLLADVIERLEKGLSFVAISTPFPGTPLWEEAEKLGIQIKVRDWSKYDLNTPIYETAGVSGNDLRKAIFYFAHRRDRRTNPGLSGSSQEEIDIIRENIIHNLRS